MYLRRTAKGDRLPSDWGLHLMALSFKVRDLFRPRAQILRDAGIGAGYQVLDYGCGPGSYTIALSELVGKTGKVYALDAHPLAVKMVRKIVSNRHLRNVETILSECFTGLPDNGLDAIILYDILHDLGDEDCVLGEIHRLLKPGGLLSVRDHHLKETEIVTRTTNRGLFKLSGKGKSNYSFIKV